MKNWLEFELRPELAIESSPCGGERPPPPVNLAERLNQSGRRTHLPVVRAGAAIEALVVEFAPIDGLAALAVARGDVARLQDLPRHDAVHLTEKAPAAL